MNAAKPPGARRPYRAIGGVAVLKAANTVLNLLLAIVLARLLGPTGYGVYAFALAVIALMASPMHLGLPLLLIREIAAYASAGAYSRVRGLIGWAARLAGLSCLAGLGLALLGLWLAEGLLSPAERAAVLAGLALLVFRTGLYVANGVLLGFNQAVASQAAQLLVQPVLFVLFIGLLIGLSGPVAVTPVSAILASATAAALAFGLMLVLLRRRAPGAVWTVGAQSEPARWRTSLLPLTALAGLEMLSNQVDIFLLGMLATEAETGLYRVAFSAAAVVLLCRTVTDAVIGPRISALWSQGQRDELQELLRWAARLGLAVALPVALVLVVFGSVLITFAFGAPYAEAYPILVVLVLGQLVNAATGPVALALQMSGHERETVRGAALAGVGNIILTAALIPLFGAMGAAVATVTTLIGLNLGLLWRLQFRTGLRAAVI